MDAAQALADLTEISSQIETAVLFDESGEVAGSTLPDERAAAELARAAGALLARGAALGSGAVTQVEAATPAGSVFVVRDGTRLIAATTAPDPTTGLVFYDLKSCLRDAAKVPDTVKPKRRRTTKKVPDET
jgi:predicted regulator of Ras-like GTPase activity (Roadblock/LC7/MglB family)